MCFWTSTGRPRQAWGHQVHRAKVFATLGLTDTQPGPDEASALLGGAEPERVCAELVHAGIGVRGFSVAAPSLEDLFVGLTGEGFDVDG